MKICKTKMDKMEHIKKTKVSNANVSNAPNTCSMFNILEPLNCLFCITSNPKCKKKPPL